MNSRCGVDSNELKRGKPAGNATIVAAHAVSSTVRCMTVGGWCPGSKTAGGREGNSIEKLMTYYELL
jgi:hypothetical protein